MIIIYNKRMNQKRSILIFGTMFMLKYYKLPYQDINTIIQHYNHIFKSNDLISYPCVLIKYKYIIKKDFGKIISNDVFSILSRGRKIYIKKY